MISNRDIGFVHVGQDAQIKVDTFNFTRYGLLHGRGVERFARRDRPRCSGGQTRDNTAKLRKRRAANPKARNSATLRVYRSIGRRIQVEDALANLSPGMAVTVEIKTGSPRIISYLLSPLLKYGHDMLKRAVSSFSAASASLRCFSANSLHRPAASCFEAVAAIA